ncbi:MAG: XRE family transcriptional regulator [Candidatus Rokubacteria bacterium]|nr:XRE family transcriptional regulator [Candidatus Rokubacteria bacterium]
MTSISPGIACACCSTSGRAERDRWSVKKVKLTRSTGNVFRDLGFSPDEAAHLKLRSDLMLNLQKAIAARGMKQGEAAELLGVTQPRVSDLMRGRIDLFSIDTLIDMLAKLGMRAKVVLQPSRRRAGVA